MKAEGTDVAFAPHFYTKTGTVAETGIAIRKARSPRSTGKPSG
jgi:hypothetical protein